MTMDELLSSEVFLRALEMYYEQKLQRVDEEFAGEAHTFSPAFLRQMEGLINGESP